MAGLSDEQLDTLVRIAETLGYLHADDGEAPRRRLSRHHAPTASGAAVARDAS